MSDSCPGNLESILIFVKINMSPGAGMTKYKCFMIYEMIWENSGRWTERSGVWYGKCLACQFSTNKTLFKIHTYQSHFRVTDDVEKISAAKLKRGDETPERRKNRLNFCLLAPAPRLESRWRWLRLQARPAAGCWSVSEGIKPLRT